MAVSRLLKKSERSENSPRNLPQSSRETIRKKGWNPNYPAKNNLVLVQTRSNVAKLANFVGREKFHFIKQKHRGCLNYAVFIIRNTSQCNERYRAGVPLVICLQTHMPNTWYSSLSMTISWKRSSHLNHRDGRFRDSS